MKTLTDRIKEIVEGQDLIFLRATDPEANIEVDQIDLSLGKAIVLFNTLPAVQVVASPLSGYTYREMPINIQVLKIDELDSTTYAGDTLRQECGEIAEKLYDLISRDDAIDLDPAVPLDGYDSNYSDQVRIYDKILTGVELTFTLPMTRRSFFCGGTLLEDYVLSHFQPGVNGHVDILSEEQSLPVMLISKLDLNGVDRSAEILGLVGKVMTITDAGGVTNSYKFTAAPIDAGNTYIFDGDQSMIARVVFTEKFNLPDAQPGNIAATFSYKSAPNFAAPALTATPVSDTEILLSWDGDTPGGWNLYDSALELIASVPGSTHTYLLSGLLPSTLYQNFHVFGTSSDNATPKSNYADAETDTPVIPPPPIPWEYPQDFIDSGNYFRANNEMVIFQEGETGNAVVQAGNYQGFQFMTQQTNGAFGADFYKNGVREFGIRVETTGDISLIHPGGTDTFLDVSFPWDSTFTRAHYWVIYEARFIAAGQIKFTAYYMPPNYYPSRAGVFEKDLGTYATAETGFDMRVYASQTNRQTYLLNYLKNYIP